NAHLAFAGRDDSRAVGTDKASFLEVHGGGGANHVDYGNALGDADDQRQVGVGSFQNGIGRVGWRNEDNRSIGSGRFHGFRDGVENGALEMFAPAFSRSYATDYVGAVLNHLLRMERSFAAGKTLHEDACFLVYEDAHNVSPEG